MRTRINHRGLVITAVTAPTKTRALTKPFHLQPVKMRTCLGRAYEVFRRGERLIEVPTRRLFFEHIVAALLHKSRPQSLPNKKLHSQEKIESPARRVPRNIRYEAAIQAAPSLRLLYLPQGVIYVLSDAARRILRRHLEFDLEEVQGVHAQRGGDTSSEPGSCMVLNNKISTRAG
jgi:hypothetical protein